MTSISEAANLARLGEIVDTTLVISAQLFYGEDSIFLPGQGEEFLLAGEVYQSIAQVKIYEQISSLYIHTHMVATGHSLKTHICCFQLLSAFSDYVEIVCNKYASKLTY